MPLDLKQILDSIGEAQIIPTPALKLKRQPMKFRKQLDLKLTKKQIKIVPNVYLKKDYQKADVRFMAKVKQLEGSQ